MTARQLYHHILAMDQPEWDKVREMGGVLAGINSSKMYEHPDMHSIIRHVHDRYKFERTADGGLITGGGVDVGGNLYDLSFCRTPLLASERLEYEKEGGGFAHALSSSLYASAVAPLATKFPRIVGGGLSDIDRLRGVLPGSTMMHMNQRR